MTLPPFFTRRSLMNTFCVLSLLQGATDFLYAAREEPAEETLYTNSPSQLSIVSAEHLHQSIEKEFAALESQQKALTPCLQEYLASTYLEPQDNGKIPSLEILQAELTHNSTLSRKHQRVFRRYYPDFNELKVFQRGRLTKTDIKDLLLKGMLPDALEDLNLSREPLSPQCFEELLEFKNLEKINLSQTGMTPQDLVTLYGLQTFPNLKAINLKGNTLLTPENIDRVREVLPDCRIVSDFVK